MDIDKAGHVQNSDLELLLAASMRAVANDAHLDVSFSPMLDMHQSRIDGKQVMLPMIKDSNQDNHFSVFRGGADRLSLWRRFHDASFHVEYSPKKGLEKSLFDVCEYMRVEALGAVWIPGVASNLFHYLDHYYAELSLETLSDTEHVCVLVATVLRIKLYDYTPSDVMRKWVSDHGKMVMVQGKEYFEQMKVSIYSQSVFSEHSRAFIESLSLMSQGAAPNTAEHSEEDDGANQKDDSGEGQTNDGSVNVSLLLSAFMQTEVELASSGDVPQQSSLDDSSGDDDSDSALSFHRPNDFGMAGGKLYKMYTHEYDEIVAADDLCDLDELTRLRHQLDQKLDDVKDVSRKLAQKLRMKLLAYQQRSWDFNLDDGYLDSGRLATLVADPNFTYCYKRLKNDDSLDTVVTLLLDNSGSMRGRPVTIAALCADVLARTLEQCGVKVEILGFTSCDWKGGKSRIKWQQEGSPVFPGRLNDLRHIIYKSADQSWRRARRNLGLMLREGLLKENIDGEAVLWAYNRLIGRAEKRRILMVISDGAPVDDSTLSVNEASYLDDHLHHVIQTIESRSEVELLAIGIGHDVARYYKRAATINNVDELGDAMYRQMMELFG